jgi:AraC-like DNA-binding protein
MMNEYLYSYNDLNKHSALNGIKSVKISTKIETLQRLNKARGFMDECFLQNPTMNEVARFGNMSSFHFFRSFKQAFGITPYKYLLHKRLEHSKILLSQKIPATEIAKLCGFADIFTYSKAFKKTYGIPPSKFFIS